MNDSIPVLLVLLGLIAANQLAARVAVMRESGRLFWLLQCVNLAFVSYVLAWGLPGFEQYPAVSWAIGLLFMLRIVYTNGMRARHLRQKPAQSPRQKEKEVQRMLDAIRAGEDES